MNDRELLHDYASSQSEAAFRELVERHLPLVYSAALRQVGEPALAQDVAQVVFMILARKADRLSSGTILPGWLFRTTRHIALKAMRSEQRRRHREQEALQMQSAQPEDAWEQLAPRLDDALAQLGEVDRNAVLLHYFQNKRLRDVGFALGMSEDTAQKRVARALEKLRKLLLKRGVALPVVFLPGLLMSHGAQAAPSYLANSVVAAAFGRAAFSTPVYALLREALRQSPWPKVGAAILKTAALAMVAGAAIYLWRKPTPQSSAALTLESKIVPRSHLDAPPAPLPISIPPPVAAAPKLADASLTTNPLPLGQSIVYRPRPVLITNLPIRLAAVTHPAVSNEDTPGLISMSAVPPSLAQPAAAAPALPVSYPAGYPVVYGVSFSGRVPPVFPRAGAQPQPPEKSIQPIFYNTPSPWMPLQTVTMPVRNQWNSPMPKKKPQ